MLATETMYVVQEHVFTEPDETGGGRLLHAPGDRITLRRAAELGLIEAPADEPADEAAANAMPVQVLVPAGVRVAYALAVACDDIDPDTVPLAAFKATLDETLERVTRLHSRAADAELALAAVTAPTVEADAGDKDPDATAEPVPQEDPGPKPEGDKPKADRSHTRHRPGPSESR